MLIDTLNDIEELEPYDTMLEPYDTMEIEGLFAKNKKIRNLKIGLARSA